MPYRHFELEDLLSEALIALEGRRWDDAERAVRRALRWVEAEWLATPSTAPPAVGGTAPADGSDQEDDD